MENKKICLVIPSLHVGGMERVMSELANYFSENNTVETHLIVLAKGSKFYNISDKVIIHEPDFQFNNKKRIYSIFKTIFFLRNNIKLIKPYSVLSFGEMYNSFVLFSCLFLNTKVYVSDRSRPNKNWGLFHELMRKLLYKTSFGIISQTNYSKQYLHRITNHKNIVVIPNPIRINETKTFEKQKVILNVGRLIASKKIDVLLKIFAEINNKDWQLWIVGEGSEHLKMVQLVDILNIKERVTFWGTIKEVEKFYAQSKIFAFTSISEGFPNALLEALSFGLPCISFDCISGPADLIEENKNGFLIPEMDIQLYKSKLNLLMQDDDFVEKLSKGAKKSALKYDIKNIGQRYLDTLLA